MKYLSLLIIPFFIMSCALEKEETNQVDSVFSFTTASVKIDNVSNNSNVYFFPPACIDFTKGGGVINYTIISKGNYGSTDVDAVIRNSYLQFDRARIYLNDTPIEIARPENLKYNSSVSLEAPLTKDMLGSLLEGTYRLEIELVASEFNGNNVSTALKNTFSGYFGEVTLDFIGRGCQ